jgi:hypothetical protein
MIVAEAVSKAVETLVEASRQPLNPPYWLLYRSKGHRSKLRVRPPYKGLFKSNPARNLYRGDVWWLQK